jgi:hypothetical protein
MSRLDCGVVVSLREGNTVTGDYAQADLNSPTRAAGKLMGRGPNPDEAGYARPGAGRGLFLRAGPGETWNLAKCSRDISTTIRLCK